MRYESVFLASGLALVLAGSAFAQSSEYGAGTQPEQVGESENLQVNARDGEILPEQRPNQVLAEDLIGMDVVNPQGESLGTVTDLVLDKEGGLAGIILSAGGFLGIGDKPVGIAWSDLSAAAGQDVLRLDLSVDQVARATEFKTSAEREAERQREEMMKQQEELQQQQQQDLPTSTSQQ